MTKENSLIHAKVLPGLLRFAIPVLAAMFLQALYGGADLLIVGQFASTGDVSGVSTGSMLLHVLTNLVVGLTMGVTVFVGQKIGEQKPDEAGKAIGSAILLFSIMGVILSIFTIIFTKPLAILLHAPSEAFAETCQYIRVCGGGLIFIVFYNLLENKRKCSGGLFMENLKDRKQGTLISFLCILCLLLSVSTMKGLPSVPSPLMFA